MQPPDIREELHLPAREAYRNIILSAFALHYGGGAVLLHEFVRSLGNHVRFATIDWRIAETLRPALPCMDVVPSRLTSRIAALIRVAREGQAGDCIFCLNSLPPLVRSSAHTIVYVHSAQFAGLMSGIRYPFLVRLRHLLEKGLFTLGYRNADEFWVQTESVKAALQRKFKGISVRVMPFVDAEAITASAHDNVSLSDVPTFFYPADGSAHKNHIRLFQAWRGINPGPRGVRLVVTLEAESFDRLVAEAGVADLVGTRVINAGRLERPAVLDLLDRAHALIFPSLVETFGLPLVEARARSIPIIASERDFVRDVCEPVQTFDPLSTLSITRAVERFLGTSIPPAMPKTGAEMAQLLPGFRSVR